MKLLKLIRGLPGSGKTRYSRDAIIITEQQFPTVPIELYEADDYFFYGGEYRFNPAKIGEAHADCQTRVAEFMGDNDSLGVVVVANTFSQQWEMTVYYLLASAYGYTVEQIDLFDSGLSDAQLAERCVHGVPVEKIAQMRARWEH
jgi:hypothetical protein